MKRKYGKTLGLGCLGFIVVFTGIYFAVIRPLAQKAVAEKVVKDSLRYRTLDSLEKIRLADSAASEERARRWLDSIDKLPKKPVAKSTESDAYSDSLSRAVDERQMREAAERKAFESSRWKKPGETFEEWKSNRWNSTPNNRQSP